MSKINNNNMIKTIHPTPNPSSFDESAATAGTTIKVDVTTTFGLCVVRRTTYVKEELTFIFE